MTNKSLMPADALRKLPKLRYIGVLATGYNIVDVKAARELRMTVTNIPTYGTASVAQFAFALLLELCHRAGMHSDAVRAGEWSRSADWCFWKSPLVELAGKTMGIVGFGRIGRQAARIADAMGMRVIAHDAVRQEPPDYEGFRWCELDELVSEADVVSLHCPLSAETEGMIHAERLRRMKRTAFLINTSRGPLVNEGDLAQALEQGIIAGAGLDVLPVEPPPFSPLFQARNCIITPHVAWATREARARLMQAAIDNLAAFLGGRPQNVVS
jgi:glycerate dehydrogenase